MFVTLEGKYTEIGVVSQGFACAVPLNPGVYARVSRFTDWIRQQVQTAR
jgi:integrin beta 3